MSRLIGWGSGDVPRNTISRVAYIALSVISRVPVASVWRNCSITGDVVLKSPFLYSPATCIFLILDSPPSSAYDNAYFVLNVFCCGSAAKNLSMPMPIKYPPSKDKSMLPTKLYSMSCAILPNVRMFISAVMVVSRMFNGICRDNSVPSILKRFNWANMSYLFLSRVNVASKLPRSWSDIENVWESGFSAYTKFLNTVPLYIIASADSDMFSGNSNGIVIGSVVKNDNSS